jgi:hypothetical protein
MIKAPAKSAEDWYAKNDHMMSKLWEHFSEELSKRTTSAYELSIFVAPLIERNRS